MNRTSIYIGRFLLFIFAACMVFTSYNFYFLGRVWSANTFVSIFYFIYIVPHISSVSNLSKIFGRFIHLPILYFLLLLFFNTINQDPLFNVPIFNSTLFLSLLIFYSLLIHAEYDQFAMNFGIMGYAIGGILLSVFFLLGIGIEYNIETERMTIFGQNPNGVGLTMAISVFVVFFEFFLNDSFHLRKLKFLWLLSIIPCISLLLLTGSRTALIVLFVGAILGLLYYPSNSAYSRIFIFLIGGIFLLILVQHLMLSDNVMVNRLLRFVEDDDTSGRGDIILALLPSIQNHFLWGAGETGYVSESIKYIQSYTIINGIKYGYSPHNVIVELLLYTGIYGLIVWGGFWYFLTKKAFFLTSIFRQPISMILMLGIIGSILSGQILECRWSYLFYCYIISLFFEKTLKISK